ncbi:hypothetical protein [Nocardioides humi]|nr:hypothetical protein [Nocardioides humi]
MTLLKRPLASAGAAALLALSLTACGGGAPTDASVEDFCKASQNTEAGQDFFQAIQDEDWDKVEDLVKKQAEELEKVGTPEDIPDDAREGFEIQLDAAKKVDADDIEKAFKDDKDPFEAEISKDDQKKAEAFNTYQSETCSDADGGSTELPSDLPTDLPTDDIPTDIPTDLSDLPSDLPTSPEELESFLSDLPSEIPTE